MIKRLKLHLGARYAYSLYGILSHTSPQVVQQGIGLPLEDGRHFVIQDHHRYLEMNHK